MKCACPPCNHTEFLTDDGYCQFCSVTCSPIAYVDGKPARMHYSQESLIENHKAFSQKSNNKSVPVNYASIREAAGSIAKIIPDGKFKKSIDGFISGADTVAEAMNKPEVIDVLSAMAKLISKERKK